MGIGTTELLLILGVILLVFGTRKLQSIGGDLGGAIRNFRTAMKEEGAAAPAVVDKSAERVG